MIDPIVVGRRHRMAVPVWPSQPAKRMALESWRRLSETGDRFALWVMAAYLMHANMGRNPDAALRLAEKHARTRQNREGL